MKKTSHNYSWLAILIVMAIAAVPSLLLGVSSNPKTENKIVKSATDERGLTSITYVQDGKTWALDYLDPKQLDSIKKHFTRGCLDRPCAHGICQGVCGPGGGLCDCCAETNGYCKLHSNQAPKKDPPLTK